MTFDALLAGLVVPSIFCWDGDPARDLAADAVAGGWAAWSLDTSSIASVEDFYREVQEACSLPSWFGRNLDALLDSLRGLVAVGPALLAWDGAGALERVDDVVCADVLDVLRTVIEQSATFAVVMRADPVAVIDVLT